MLQLPNKKYLPLIIAGVSGLVAVFLINSYIEQRTREERERKEKYRSDLITVLIAKQDIPAGTAITEKMLKEETVHKSTLQPRAVTSIDRAIDKIAMVDIPKGAQVLLSNITLPGQETGLSPKIPRGKRAITVSVDNTSSVGGMLRPGDHVDVIGVVPISATNAEGKQVVQMTTLALFQDVLVLAIGQEFTSAPRVADEKKGERAEPSPNITLALSPQEANLIAFVQEQGKIRLALRSPEDTKTEPASPASWDTLFRAVMPQAYQTGGNEPLKAQKKVEIYRGLQREEKVISERGQQ